MDLNEPGSIDILITRFLTGTADSEEKDALVKWIALSRDNAKYFYQVKNIWNISGELFYKKKINNEKALAKVLKRISGKNKSETLWRYWQKAAALILIPLLAANILWLLFGPDYAGLSGNAINNEVFAAYGTRTALKLSDGTAVWLNSGSTIKYPDKFRGKKRVVDLNGEAYFKVASDSVMPFLVQTGSITVKATGTEFNVSDYASDKNASVALVSGKVSIMETADNDKGRHETELAPYQLFELTKATGEINVENEDITEYTSWRDGKLIFRNKPLSYVVKKISQIHNVDIELRGKILQDYRYRATFEDESLSEILKLLKVSSPIDYIEVKREPLPDGSFEKRKVIIFPRRQKSEP
jgi:ferric-dicitrate binding protein FerR (iron transport regulator)